MPRLYRVKSPSGLNLRDTPWASGAGPVHTLPLGASVTREGEEDRNGFWRVSVEIRGATASGWVSSTGLEPVPEIGPGETLIEAFHWTLQTMPAPQNGWFVRAGAVTHLRYMGIDGRERRVLVDLDYVPPSLDALPPGLTPAQSSTEMGWTARALLGWMLGRGSPLGTVVPFELGAVPCAGRLEVHSNAPKGVTVYHRTFWP